jgi:hypothetical protein
MTSRMSACYSPKWSCCWSSSREGGLRLRHSALSHFLDSTS